MQSFLRYNQFMDELLKDGAQIISQQYKISYEDTLKRLEEQYSKDLKLQKRIQGITSAHEISRIREYKDFLKKAKKDIYYSLRQFHADEHGEQALLGEIRKGNPDKQLYYQLAQTHISSKEREPHIEAFNKQLLLLAENSSSILDVGGGVFPLRFPFEKFPNLTDYIWIDKDTRAFKTLEPFADTLENVNLELHNESIGEHPWESYLPQGQTQFDLVLMIKLISLIYRQERAFIKYLTEVPAKRILVTSPKESMTKNQSIYYRENEILKEFIKVSGRRVINRFEIPNEFGYLLE